MHVGIFILRTLTEYLSATIFRTISICIHRQLRFWLLTINTRILSLRNLLIRAMDKGDEISKDESTRGFIHMPPTSLYNDSYVLYVLSLVSFHDSLKSEDNQMENCTIFIRHIK